MVTRYDVGYRDDYRAFCTAYEEHECEDGVYVRYEDIKELEAENARLRQQRDAANAQLDFLIEEMKKAP